VRFTSEDSIDRNAISPVFGLIRKIAVPVEGIVDGVTQVPSPPLAQSSEEPHTYVLVHVKNALSRSRFRICPG
jgi:hypothetical protein